MPCLVYNCSPLTLSNYCKPGVRTEIAIANALNHDPRFDTAALWLRKWPANPHSSECWAPPHCHLEHLGEKCAVSLGVPAREVSWIISGTNLLPMFYLNVTHNLRFKDSDMQTISLSPAPLQTPSVPGGGRHSGVGVAKVQKGLVWWPVHWCS